MIKTNHAILPVVFVTILIGSIATTYGVDPPTTTLKTETFDRDPGWDGFNNRLVPEVAPKVTQDFGYSDTSFASKAHGELWPD
jgi:hypothetical protein